ncbi:S8 family serine peptidase [Streptomyces cadmiisoli]|uniref:Serine protease n=1 Tax=Streptomyces cadmiisoli TaxID=2184053 RepID=A0A2Z4IT84_9ACTN|nr:S8 family serine peptidase [Streptomyces cadmiisoli]AWW35828.1 serine protease [Streptomyces cadmiisoli]
MKARARGVARLLSGAGLAASLLLPASAAAQAAPLSRTPAADGQQGQELPGMPSALDPRAEQAVCTPASRATAKKQDWSRHRLDLDRLRRHGTGAGVTVALIGSGVAPDAVGLSGRVTARGAAGDDCVGHGTFLAGLIAGTGGGSPRLAGVAPGARILALRGTDTRGAAGAALVTEALREATEAGADVIAVAVAVPRRDAALSRAVAEAQRSGAVVIAAATPDPPRGGTDKIPSRTYWPAGEPGVLSVADMVPGGTRPKGSLPTDGIDLVAPGAAVVSGGPRGAGHYLGGGASAATAYAAGAAAVVRAAHPDEPATAVLRRLTGSAYPAYIPQLDPYAAVTTVLDDSTGSTGVDRAAGPVTVRDTSAGDRATNRALLFVLLGTSAVLAVLWAAFALPRARARGWRPAEAEAETGAAGRQ